MCLKSYIVEQEHCILVHDMQYFDIKCMLSYYVRRIGSKHSKIDLSFWTIWSTSLLALISLDSSNA